MTTYELRISAQSSDLFSSDLAHAQLRLKVKHDARIERPATRSHHQPIEGREPHGRVDALPVPHRAQARAVSEMRRDHPPIGKRPVDGSQLPGDIFVGQSMKSIAADSLLMQRAGEREPRGDLGLVVVKRGIETGDLGKV